MSNSKRLGRGLQALLGGSFGEQEETQPDSLPGLRIAQTDDHDDDPDTHDAPAESLAASPQASEESTASEETGLILLGVDDVKVTGGQQFRDLAGHCRQRVAGDGDGYAASQGDQSTADGPAGTGRQEDRRSAVRLP